MSVQLSKTEQVKVRLEKEKPRLVNLQKDAQIVVREYSLDGEIIRVVLVLDASGSMSGQYERGRVQLVVDRMTTVALNFDDNGELEVWGYASGHAKLPVITLENLDTYVREIMAGRAPVVTAAPAASSSPAPAKKKGFWGKLGDMLSGGSSDSTPAATSSYQTQPIRGQWGNLGAGILPGLSYDNNEPPVMRSILDDSKSTPNTPTLVIFVTDGGIDKGEAIKKVLVEASRFPIFWQFVGIGGNNYGVLEDFDTMEGRYVDNANFFALDDIDSISVKELYKRLLGEFPAWLEKVRKLGMIPAKPAGK
jgi:hypothetical protein